MRVKKFYIVFFVLYILLYFLTAPFLLSWGVHSVFRKFVIFFFHFPLSYEVGVKYVNWLFIVFINSFAWTVIIFLVINLIKYIRKVGNTSN